MTALFKSLLGAMLQIKFLSYTVHSGQLHTSVKHLLGTVIQYKDIQTHFVFLLRKMELLSYQCLDDTCLFHSNQFRVDLEGYYIQFDYVYNKKKGSTAFSLHSLALNFAKSQ